MIEVAILGVGLIGGSLALSLKKHENVHITGFDVNENNLQMAVSLGVIDQGTSHLAEAVSAADYIFLSAPVETLHELISFLRYTPLKQGAVICDTGSTKKTVVKMAQGLEKKGIYFIGGHPMAGSHQSGVEASNDRLFDKCLFRVNSIGRNTGKSSGCLKGVTCSNPWESDCHGYACMTRWWVPLAIFLISLLRPL